MFRTQVKLAAAAIAAFVCLTSDLMAQAPSPGRESPVFAAKLNLTMEQRHIIMEFIKSRNTTNEPSNVSTAVGQTVPKTVQLQAMPADVAQKVSQVRNYSYFIKSNKIVLVDPKDNKIAEVIELQ